MTLQKCPLNDDDLEAIKALALDGQTIDSDLESLLIETLE